MSERTDRFDLNTLGPGSRIQDDGWKFGLADRRSMDRLLRLGAEDHRHTGAAPSDVIPDFPTLVLVLTGGSIPAGTRVYYVYTLVDADGSESLPSASAFVDTPPPLVEPGAPVLTTSAAGGLLLPGQYFYVVTAYVTVNTQETRAVQPAPVTVPIGTSTNTVTLTLPSPQAGSTGFCVYRRGPGDSRYNFIASTTASSYVDDGSIEPDCNRTIPQINNTNASNAVTIDIGDAGVDPPPGSSWKVYRSYDGTWSSTLLHHVVEETAEGSGIVSPVFADLGLNVLAGSPPSVSQQVRSPSRVSLTDGVEVQGLLPMGRVAGFPVVVTFAFIGSLVGTFEGTTVWVNEFPRASIVGVRPALGRGSAPAAQPDIFDVNYGSGATPTMESVFAGPGDLPQVEVGNQIGERVAATAVSELLEGDCLSADLVQAGGGATPTDIDASINVYLLAHGFPETSFVPGVDRRSPPGMVAWYRARDLVVSNGSPVPTWADAAGVSPNLAAASLIPSFATGAINGLPAVVFSGDSLKTADFAALVQPITVFLVAKFDVVGEQILFAGDGVDSLVGKNTFPRFAAGAGLAVVGPAADTDWHIICVELDGATSRISIGGGQGVVGNGGTTSLSAITLGSVGTQDGSFLVGRVAEVIVYQGERTTEDINTPGRYLAETFALTWADRA